MFDDVLQDVRYALRALCSSPGFSAIAILSLALGIGANTAIFSLINAVILKTLPVSHPEQLVQLVMKTENGTTFTNPIWEQVRDRQDVFSGAFAYSPIQLNLAGGGEVRNASVSWVSGDFFRTLRRGRCLHGQVQPFPGQDSGCLRGTIAPMDPRTKTSRCPRERDGSSGRRRRTVLRPSRPAQHQSVAGFWRANEVTAAR